MKSCEGCIFWPVCEDWSIDYYNMLGDGDKNPFPLEGDILNECKLYKPASLYEIKRKTIIKTPSAEYFGPVVAVVDYYEDGILDQVFHHKGRKTEDGYVWESDNIFAPNKNHDITIYKANGEGEIISYFPLERLWR